MTDRSTRSEARDRAGDTAAQWREELRRNALRMTNLATMLMDPTPPVVGVTPREEIYRRGKARLYRYRPETIRHGAVLFVPNLGLSRPYIFDLQPGMSFTEYMVGQGFDFYLLDWGEFGPEDRDLTMEECITRVLPRAVSRTLNAAGEPALSMLGYCMGSTLAASYLGMHPDAPVTAFVNMAGPIDFDRAGLFGCWLQPRVFDVDKVVAAFGMLPVEMVQAGMRLLKPTMDLTARLNLWWNLWNGEYVRGFRALNAWSNDFVPMPGEFFREWVKGFYQENRLFRGTLAYGGRPVRLDAIRCPVLVVGAKEDHIVPGPCARALLDLVGSRDREYIELPGGHISLIAGRSAPRDCWPRISRWLGARDRRGREAT